MTVPSKLRLSVAILAAGQSRRFGEADKLAQPLGEIPLALHIARTVSQLESGQKLVVAASQDHPCGADWRELGFTLAVNENAGEGMGTSVALAAKRAAEGNADALLICLADMPFIPLEHLQRMIGLFEQDGNRTTIASHDGSASLPPVIFGAALFPQLSRLTGQEGARAYLAAAKTLQLRERFLADIDTASDLALADSRSARQHNPVTETKGHLP